MTPQQFRKMIKAMGIKVLSLEECAKSDFHVCSDRPNPALREQESVCSECGKPIFFTQVFPPGPQPRKVCPQCAEGLARGEKDLSA